MNRGKVAPRARVVIFPVPGARFAHPGFMLSPASRVCVEEASRFGADRAKCSRKCDNRRNPRTQRTCNPRNLLNFPMASSLPLIGGTQATNVRPVASQSVRLRHLVQEMPVNQGGAISGFCRTTRSALPHHSQYSIPTGEVKSCIDYCFWLF